MSSTNKTTNYELSQYVGTDKPTYLGDYNSDMLKIDAQMKVNANGVASATSTANTASETANTAITNASTAQTTAETAQANATTAGNTANTALNKANANEANITALQNKFNLNNIKQYNASDMIVNNNSFTITGTGGLARITVATNSDGSIAKIYGNIAGTASPTEPVSISIMTDLRPAEDFTISPMGILRKTDNNQLVGIYSVDVKTTGEIIFRTAGVGGYPIQMIALPFVIFVSDFGDTE